MPAVLTHDFFGRDMLTRSDALRSFDQDQRDAFLLGNQGPDPLFYLTVLAPVNARKLLGLGSRMHHEKPTELLAAMRQAADQVEPEQRAVGLAYALGFLCHYTLDSTMHPFVYSQQYAICEAGINGIGPEDGSDVHAEIERRFDEMVLYVTTGKTILDYKPYLETLHATDETLAAIDAVYVAAIKSVYDLDIPSDLFTQAAKRFRFTQRAFYSPKMRAHLLLTGIEHNVLGRNHSFYAAMAHRVNASSTCAFDNNEHATWASPFTGATSTDGFWDLFAKAKLAACDRITPFMAEGFDQEQARAMTHGIDFNGEPIE